MAVILPHGRPAIDVVAGSYPAPDRPWAHLDEPAVRARLEPAIAAVGRLGLGAGGGMTFLGTAFVAGPDLLLAASFGQVQQRIDAGDPPTVDFGHELAGGDAPLVTVTEVVRTDPRYGVELLRAELPATIRPLPLAGRQPAELTDRDVVLVCYPGPDARGDAALLRRIFRGALGVKRMLPGRSQGAARFSRGSTDLDVLAHDCSSSGGCAGAPLIDLETGAAVGLHFAGDPLRANYAVPAPVLVQLLEELGTRSLGGPAVVIGAPAAEPPTTAAEPPLSAHDDAGTLGGDRPALPAATWERELSGPWAAVLRPRRSQLDVALRAVGKVRPDLDRPDWNGGAFVVGDRLALTASFCAQAFTAGAGAAATIRPGSTPGVDFGDALGLPAGTAVSPVTGVRFVHPCFHVALLELAELPPGVGLLELASQLPAGLSGRLVALLAFAADRGGGLHVQPGKALQIGELPDASRLPALAHDCSSGSGSAGGPVIDLGTGYVVGLHTHKKPGTGGFAQCAWELARDPHVWEHEISFRPDPRPSWLGAWDIPGAGPAHPVGPAPAPDGRWTVDEVPIDWRLAEPRALEQLIRDNVESQFARFLAENAGVPLGTINFGVAPTFLWRDILRTASVAGVLRRLLEEITGAPEHAGIAPKLRVYL